MPISHKYKCIFVHIPKTAGTAIEYNLAMHGNLKTIGIKPYTNQEPNLDTLFGKGLQHLTVEQLKSAIKNEKIFTNYFKFAFVRNPWDRAVSQASWRAKKWVNKIELNSMEFKRYVTHIYKQYKKQELNSTHSKPQWTFIFNRSGLNMMDFVGRFETLHEDWELICGKINNSKLELERRMVSFHKPYQEYYTASTIEIIAEIYQMDIKLFNYQF
jgi:sulfotransferase famil protein